MKRKYKKYIKNNKGLVILIAILLIFPIVVGLIYALPLPQIVAIDSGDLLGYYATTFGILGSFYTYRLEKRKNEKERKSELKPNFIIEIIKRDKNDIFSLKISNHARSSISHLYLYDVFLSAEAKEKYTLKISYLKSIEEVNKLKPDFNITADDDIIDVDGYPKYIHLMCDDSDRNTWSCCYRKITDCEKIYYYPRDFEIL